MGGSSKEISFKVFREGMATWWLDRFAGKDNKPFLEKRVAERFCERNRYGTEYAIDPLPVTGQLRW